MDIYLDQNQCETFGLDYMNGRAKITICAKILLESKGGDGYDEQHKRMLQPTIEAGGDVVLVQTERPGWCRIIAVV